MLHFFTAPIVSALLATCPDSWLMIQHNAGGIATSISIAELDSEIDGPASQLAALLTPVSADRGLACTDYFQGIKSCTVRLDSETTLHQTLANFPKAGQWQVIFTGAAALELHRLLEGSPATSGVPGRYRSTPSGMIVCEPAEQACVIRNFAGCSPSTDE